MNFLFSFAVSSIRNKYAPRAVTLIAYIALPIPLKKGLGPGAQSYF